MKRVLFIMSWYNHETHRGIARYAGEHGWHLNAKMVLESEVPTHWNGDGIITAVPVKGGPIYRLLENTASEVVYLDSRNDRNWYPSICLDHRRIVEQARDYLRSKGYRRFICYYDKGSVPGTIR